MSLVTGILLKSIIPNFSSEDESYLKIAMLIHGEYPSLIDLVSWMWITASKISILNSLDGMRRV